MKKNIHRKIQGEQHLVEMEKRLSLVHCIRMAVAVGKGLGMTVSALIIAMALAGMIDHHLHLPVFPRVGIAVLLYALLIMLTRRWIIRAMQGCGDLQDTAELVEKRHRELHQSLVGSIQFTRDSSPDAALETPGVFIDGMISNAYTGASRIRFGDIFRLRDIMESILMLALPLLVFFLSIFTFPELSGIYLGRIMAPGIVSFAPLSSVAIHVTPGNARVLTGMRFDIEARVFGQLSGNVVLVSRMAGDTGWRKEELTPDGNGVFHKHIQALDGAMEYLVRAGREQSDVFKVEVIRHPAIIGFAITYDYPAYSGLAGQSIRSGVGDLRGLRGTRATVKVFSDSPLTGASVDFANAVPLTYSPDGSSSFTFSYVISTNTTYVINLTGPGGIPGRTPFIYRVSTVDDAPPLVKLIIPEDNIRATVVSEVPVVFSARDDYGISSARLRFMIDDRPEQIVDFPVANRTNLNAEYLFALEDLDLKPGSQILYSIEIFDNDEWTAGISGKPKRAISELRFIMVQHFIQESILKIADGGGEPGIKKDLVALQRAVAMRTWPFVRQSLSVEQEKKLEATAEQQRKVRKVADEVSAMMRYKHAPQEHIAAVETAARLMTEAAVFLDKHDPDNAYEKQRKALTILLSVYEYMIALVESGTGASTVDTKSEEKLEEIKIKADSSFSEEKPREPGEQLAEFAAEIDRLHREQDELASEIASMKPKDRGAEEADNSGQDPAGQDMEDTQGEKMARQLDAGEIRRQADLKQNKLRDDTADLALDIELALESMQDDPALQATQSFLDDAVDSMDEVMRMMDNEVASPAQPAEMARDALASAMKAIENAGALANDGNLPAALAELEKMLAEVTLAGLNREQAPDPEDIAAKLEQLAGKLEHGATPEAAGNAKALRNAGREMTGQGENKEGQEPADAEQGGDDPAAGESENATSGSPSQPSDINDTQPGSSSDQPKGEKPSDIPAGGNAPTRSTGGFEPSTPGGMSEKVQEQCEIFTRLLSGLVARFKESPEIRQATHDQSVQTLRTVPEFKELENEYFIKFSSGQELKEAEGVSP